MPLWDIHSSPAFFSNQDKQDLATSFTRIYTERGGLPAFYVRVRFTEDAPSSSFSGGSKNDNFVHIQIWHLARVFRSNNHRDAFLNLVDGVLNPVMRHKGADWEYTVNESPRDLWKINGLVPPAAGSEMEKKWVEMNRPAVPKSSASVAQIESIGTKLNKTDLQNNYIVGYIHQALDYIH
ncbi:hypothetical protein LTR37_007836 [Vermiconidia calcicola]|uniref:Uncharacterized protein n=1 Tax=Vermiconidia calcicola TaxID=1690605 RepID=A0ACC3NCE5_9PEZI|nr:hypothetical protein LTR37_007836 [Vermiconidia calcicola]